MNKSKFKILVIDRDPDLREAYKEILNLEGFDCTHTSSSAEAFYQVVLGSVDLILSEVDLPQMNGCELFLRLKYEHSSTPFIMVTSNLRLFSIYEDSLDLFAFLEKPCSPEALIGYAREARDVHRLSFA